VTPDPAFQYAPCPKKRDQRSRSVAVQDLTLTTDRVVAPVAAAVEDGDDGLGRFAEGVAGRAGDVRTVVGACGGHVLPAVNNRGLSLIALPSGTRIHARMLDCEI